MGLLKKVKKAVSKVTAPAVKQVTAAVAPVVETVKASTQIVAALPVVESVRDTVSEVGEAIKDPSFSNIKDAVVSSAVSAQFINPLTAVITTAEWDKIKEVRDDIKAGNVGDLLGTAAKEYFGEEASEYIQTAKEFIEPYKAVASAMYEKLKADDEGQRFLSDIRDYVGDVTEKVERQLDSIFKFIGWA